MTVLIVPCAGKSSRFPNMKPKWMLTQPNGELMVESSVSKMDLNVYSRVIITITAQQDLQYEAAAILNSAFNDLAKFELCILDDWTSGPAETVAQTILKMNISDSIVVKDSDNSVEVSDSLIGNARSFVAGISLKNANVANPAMKSYIKKNSDNIILGIVEKEIVSEIISIGLYGFRDSEQFLISYNNLNSNTQIPEIYLSHVISDMISRENAVFQYIEVTNFLDWGTKEEWETYRDSYSTYFIDFDGVLVKNTGKHGSLNWSSPFEFIEENLELIIKLKNAGAQIFITSARPNSQRDLIKKSLSQIDLEVDGIILGLNHARRYLVNDFAATNKYPSAVAINIPRNGSLPHFI